MKNTSPSVSVSLTPSTGINNDLKYNQICKMTTSGDHMWAYQEVYHFGVYYAKCKICGVVDDEEPIIKD